MRKLFKHVIVIWSEVDKSGYELEDLARDAVRGESHYSKYECELVEDPSKDPDWDGTEFFGDE